MKSPASRPVAALILALTGCNPAMETSVDQLTGESITVEDYQRAERFLRDHTAELLYDTVLTHYWQYDDRLVYRKRTAAGLNTSS